MSEQSKELRAKRRYLAEQNKNWPITMSQVPAADWPKSSIPVLAVFRSRNFLATVYDEGKGGALRLSICRAELNAEGQWKDGIAWEDLQRIKSECGYGRFEAVEIYPADRDVVNVANLRHLWILKDSLPFGWRHK